MVKYDVDVVGLRYRGLPELLHTMQSNEKHVIKLQHIAAGIMGAPWARICELKICVLWESFRNFNARSILVPFA